MWLNQYSTKSVNIWDTSLWTQYYSMEIVFIAVYTNLSRKTCNYY